jgi:hypothetical protein
MIFSQLTWTFTGERDKQRVESVEWPCAVRHFLRYFR